MRAQLPIVLLFMAFASLTRCTSSSPNRMVSYVIITNEFCKTYDISTLLRTKPETGTDGVFDTSYWRIQMHFETILKDSVKPNVYHIYGFSRHKNVVTPFSGHVVINEVQQYPGNFYYAMDTSKKDFNEEGIHYISVSATYTLLEDSHFRFSGIFKGKLGFGLHKLKNKALVNDLLEYEQDGYSNFTYNGTWNQYHSIQYLQCIWGDGRLPLPRGVGIGASEFLIAEKYRHNGWERNDRFELVDNPKFWWKR